MTRGGWNGARFGAPPMLASRTSQRAAALAAMVLALSASGARAQSGVSDDRVALPDGPGSIDGIGDNAAVESNMGAMTYAVPIEVPEGHPGMSPDLTLRYSSMAGASVVGVGFSLAIPSIERLTLRGLPEYDADDEMAANGAEQLVRVGASGGSATYRARMERGFVRYTWHDVGDGRGGYWTAEWPDGRVGYFGADASGTLVPSARLEQAGNTFRWLLVEVVDPFDHRLRYSYDASSGTPLLTEVSWVHDAGGTPRYAAALEYEARPDPISDASPGFEELLTERLSAIRVRARGEVIRTYRLSYEDAATSGGVSRLAEVARYGRAGGRYPVASRFTYSRSLSGVCGGGTTDHCDSPILVDMGSVPGAGGIARGEATLIDIDGDALPDLLDTSLEHHRFYLNRLDGEGLAHFDAAARESAVGTRTPFALAQASVQVLDVNGDGFTDLVDAYGGSFLCNLGQGDWVDPTDAAYAARCGAVSPITGVTLELDDVGGGASDPDPLRTRFVDLNGDRRIDILRTDSATETRAWVNTTEGFEELAGVEALGAQFDGQFVQLAEMNGDGLLDAVMIDAAGTVMYRLSYGRGRFSRDATDRAWRTADAPAFASTSAVHLTELEDLNGDGLDDLIVVEGSTVSFAVNRNVGRFDPWRQITTADVPDLPARLDTTSVLFADMNGTGSRDVVWVEQSGRVRYLELFPVRPNLLARIENGIGMVQAVTYGRSVAHRAASEAAWRFSLSTPMSVVDRTDTWVTLTGSDGAGLHEILEYDYRDGFYDGIEKAFRGYARVEARTLAELAEDSQEPALAITTYDVGDGDPYRAGLVLAQQMFSGEDDRALREERHTYDDCDVAEAAGGLYPVRHVCETEALAIHQEGAAPEAWATTRVETAYDGYGNATRQVEHGVVHYGPPESPHSCGACANTSDDRFGDACGDACLGDERYVEREYVTPGSATGDRWITSAVHTERSYAAPGGAASETRTYYDGPEFEGLALGQLTHGRATRVVQRASADEAIAVARSALDAHGNVVISLDPLGDPSDTSGHRRAYTYDDDGLQVVRTEVFVTTPEGAPYRLRQEYAYEPALDRVVESSGWMINGAGASSARNSTYYAYDEHARLISIVQPGDSADAPSLEVSWELGDPASRVVMSRRSTPGEAPDVVQARCLDGRGRVYQELSRVRDGEWLATGFAELNRRGASVRIYQPYTLSSGACATAPPGDVRHVDLTYDGLGREVSRTLPDAELHGSASVERREYAPLAERTFEADDLDPESPNADTPDLVRMDGLGRPIALERLLRTDAGMSSATTALFYDGLGNVAGYVDAAGHEKRQSFDLAGRLVRIDDPNSGATTLEHDDAGNVIARTDARGITLRTEYDGANRPVARYDASDPDGTRITMRYDFAPDCEWPACANAESRLVEATYPLPPAILARLGGSGGADRVGYDARGRPVRLTRQLGDASFGMEETLDGLDRPVSTRFPDGQVLERRFDGAGRLVSIDGLVERIERDARGQIARIVRADGSDEVIEHDALMRLAHASSVAGGGAVLLDDTFTRDRRGQIVEIASAAGLEGALDEGTSRYRYDSLHRLAQAEIAVGLPHEETLSYQHDLIDDVLSATSSLGARSRAHAGEYTYDPARPSIATQIGQLVQAHDDAGFLVSRGATELAWDFLGRLVEARTNGEARGIFAYGADQTRVAKLEGGSLTLYVHPDFEVRDGVSRAYARIGRDRVARAQSTELGPAIYRDPDGDGAITCADALIETDDARRAALLFASARRLLHEAAPEPVQLYQDHLGSLVAATREGEVAGLTTYHPFGEIRAQTGFVDEHGFTGQERDASTGLSAFEWRYLDTFGGQWTSADPAFASIGDPLARLVESVGRYGYVRGDPTNLVDPSGLVGEEAGDATQNAYFRDLMQRVEHELDFSSPRDGAVFWTTPNGKTAEEWARNNNKVTLAQTPGGRELVALHLYKNPNLTPELARQVWNAASKRFAEQATGTVNVFAQGMVNPGPHGELTFTAVEHPILRHAQEVTINYRNNDGRIVHVEDSRPRREPFTTAPTSHGTSGSSPAPVSRSHR